MAQEIDVKKRATEIGLVFVKKGADIFKGEKASKFKEAFSLKIAEMEKEAIEATNEHLRKYYKNAFANMVDAIEDYAKGFELLVDQAFIDLAKELSTEVLSEAGKIALGILKPGWSEGSIQKDIAEDFIDHKLGKQKTKKIFRGDSMSRLVIEDFKRDVKAAIAKLEGEKLTFFSVGKALLTILVDAIEVVEIAMDMSDKKQQQFLIIAVDEILEEVDIPGIEGATELFVKEQIIERLPMIINLLLPTPQRQKKF